MSRYEESMAEGGLNWKAAGIATAITLVPLFFMLSMVGAAGRTSSVSFGLPLSSTLGTIYNFSLFVFILAIMGVCTVALLYAVKKTGGGDALDGITGAGAWDVIKWPFSKLGQGIVAAWNWSRSKNAGTVAQDVEKQLAAFDNKLQPQLSKIAEDVKAVQAEKKVLEDKIARVEESVFGTNQSILDCKKAYEQLNRLLQTPGEQINSAGKLTPLQLEQIEKQNGTCDLLQKNLQQQVKNVSEKGGEADAAKTVIAEKTARVKETSSQFAEALQKVNERVNELGKKIKELETKNSSADLQEAELLNRAHTLYQDATNTLVVAKEELVEFQKSVHTLQVLQETAQKDLLKPQTLVIMLSEQSLEAESVALTGILATLAQTSPEETTARVTTIASKKTETCIAILERILVIVQELDSKFEQQRKTIDAQSAEPLVLLQKNLPSRIEQIRNVIFKLGCVLIEAQKIADRQVQEQARKQKTKQDLTQLKQGLQQELALLEYVSNIEAKIDNTILSVVSFHGDPSDLQKVSVAVAGQLQKYAKEVLSVSKTLPEKAGEIQEIMNKLATEERPSAPGFAKLSERVRTVRNNNLTLQANILRLNKEVENLNISLPNIAQYLVTGNAANKKAIVDQLNTALASVLQHIKPVKDYISYCIKFIDAVEEERSL